MNHFPFVRDISGKRLRAQNRFYIPGLTRKRINVLPVFFANEHMRRFDPEQVDQQRTNLSNHLPDAGRGIDAAGDALQSLLLP